MAGVCRPLTACLERVSSSPGAAVGAGAADVGDGPPAADTDGFCLVESEMVDHPTMTSAE